MEYRWMIEESTEPSTNKIRFLLDGREVSTDAFAQWVRELKTEMGRLNLQNRELQERYDIYAEHLKTCVVWIAPEIPCDCGFLTKEVKRKDETQ